LRERIAVEVRTPFAAPSELAAYTRGQALAVNSRNEDYPLIVAVVLDALAEAGGSYATAAAAVGVTTSQLLKFLRADREVWRAVSEAYRD
jgi:hypothetical protein